MNIDIFLIDTFGGIDVNSVNSNVSSVTCTREGGGGLDIFFWLKIYMFGIFLSQEMDHVYFFVFKNTRN